MYYDLRVATIQDAEAVSELLRASYPRLMRSAYEEEVLSPALQVMTKANPSLLSSGKFYFAILPTGLVVGCGGWSPEQPGKETVEQGLGHIRHFAVHPDWTRRGIGRSVFTVCVRAACAAGLMTFECYSSLNAEKFYRALGFVRIREIDIELKPSLMLRGVLMRRNIYEDLVS